MEPTNLSLFGAWECLAAYADIFYTRYTPEGSSWGPAGRGSKIGRMCAWLKPSVDGTPYLCLCVRCVYVYVYVYMCVHVYMCVCQPVIVSTSLLSKLRRQLACPFLEEIRGNPQRIV
jgi:hypothetical protein